MSLRRHIRVAAEGLLPIMHPLFNLREICKQSALLEDHLNNESKRCDDCIRKHFLTIEALFEEALSLDTEQKWFEAIDGKADVVRALQEKWIDGVDVLEISNELRDLRKEFAPLCFDLREMTEESKLAFGRIPLAQHVADVHLARGVRHTATIPSGGFDYTTRTPPSDLKTIVSELREIAPLFDRGLLRGKPGTGRKVRALADLIVAGDLKGALKLAKLLDLPSLPPDLFSVLYRYGA